MENAILLQWKEFSVPTDRLNNTLKSLIGSNYDGLICGPNDFYVVFKTNPSAEEVDNITEFWDNVVELQFSPTLREIISAKINEASAFGQALILDFAVENVEMGITQANKTRAVADYCADVQRYLESGSLYAAITEINELIADTSETKTNLSPFVTNERLETYRDKIVEFIS